MNNAPRIDREKETVRWMVEIYCTRHHGKRDKTCKNNDKQNKLCDDCQALLSYAHNRLDHCRFGTNKRNCKNCPVHCYKPDMRQKMRAVMRFAGPKMLYLHPVAALRHLINR